MYSMSITKLLFFVSQGNIILFSFLVYRLDLKITIKMYFTCLDKSLFFTHDRSGIFKYQFHDLSQPFSCQLQNYRCFWNDWSGMTGF